MKSEVRQEGAALRTVTVRAAGVPGRQVSIEERRRLVAESLRVGNPASQSRDLPAQADPRQDCQIDLSVEEIHPYENNPRRAGNAKFAEIKESIRSGGIRNPLTVTRRPGESHFIIEAGGNTRLLAIQQLWAETRDSRFHRLTVLFRPWRSETHILTAHLIENELRGEMTFWDKACGIVALKSRLEAEKGRALSLRQLEDELKALGLSVNTATLAHYIFATDRLRTLGEAIPDLSGLDVKHIQPRLNLMKRHAQARASLGETEVYATVFEPVFLRAADKYRQTSVFGAAALCRACEDALALKLGQPVDQMRSELEAQSRTSPSSQDAAPVSLGASQSPQPSGIASATAGVSPLAAVSNANEPLAPPGRLVLVRELPSMNTGRAPEPFRLIEQVRRFAELAGIDDCLRFHASTPLGYAIDTLPTPADAQSPPAHRLRSWRLLALLSGQFDDGASHSLSDCLTQVDPEQRAVEAGAPPATAYQRPLDMELLDWLADAHDQVASAFWDVLSLVREARAAVAMAGELDALAPTPGNA